MFLEEPNVTGATRFGVFTIAASFALAQLGTNIAANSISAGTDLTALLPRWISIRRGSYLCAIVGLAMCPWHLLSSSNNFTTYLSAYSVFLSSIAGVMCADYYLVRKGYLQTRNLYSADRKGPYFFHGGVSWRGYAAYLAGILPNVVGFVGAVGVEVPKGELYFFFLFQKNIFFFRCLSEDTMAIHALLIARRELPVTHSLIPTLGATYLYNLNFFGGFIVAAAIYWTLCKIKPIPACSDIWREVDNDVEYDEDDDDDDDVSDERNERRGRRRRNLAYGEEESDSDAKRQTTELPKGVV